MKAVRIVSGEAAVVDVDEPLEPSGGWQVLDVAACGICGTDLQFVQGDQGGFTLGHEIAVRVSGALAAVEPTVYCGECEQCRSGAVQRCTGSHANLGVFSDGGLAERVAVPPYALVPVAASLTPEAAALVEPAAVAWHGVRKGAVEPGMRVCVVGGGSIGLLAVAALRAAGHAPDLEARHPHQVEAGERLGAGRPHGQYDVVIEAASSESGLARAAELARPAARLVLLGVYFSTVPIPGVPFIVKELECVASMAYGHEDGTRDVEEAAALLAARPEIVDTLVTHRFELEDAARAFRVAADKTSGAIKVVLLTG